MLIRRWFFWIVSCRKRMAAQTVRLTVRRLSRWMMIGAAMLAQPNSSRGLRNATGGRRLLGGSRNREHSGRPEACHPAKCRLSGAVLPRNLLPVY